MVVSDRSRWPGSHCALSVQSMTQTLVSLLPRFLARRPLYPLLVLVLVGLAVGAATAMLAVLDATVLHPLPYRDPGSLYAIWGADSATGERQSTQTPLSAIQLVRWRERTRAFDGIGAVN